MTADSASADEEQQLIDRARSGDGEAFGALVAPHRRMLMTVCFGITGNQSDAEDAVQQTLLATWRNLDRFRGHSAFSTWLYRIAHNAALAVTRRRRPEPMDPRSIPETASSPGPAAQVADRDAVRWALDQLPPDFRGAIVLREFASMTYREIAETQDVPVDTVKSRISRARVVLRALLEDAT